MRLDTPEAAYTPPERKAFMLGVLILILLLIPSVNAVKIALIHNGYVAHYEDGKSKLIQLVQDISLVPKRLLTADKDLPVIKVDIKYQDWLKLEQDRNNALKNGIIAEQRNQVNATLYLNQQKYFAKVRLQGDMLDHVSNDTRWSLRFELKKKKALFESRKFALVAPNVRIHQGPSLFSKTMELADFDIIAPKNMPVRVVLNGVDWGTMFVEQAFSQSLLAVNDRTEGLIARLDIHEQTQNSAGEITRVLKPRELQRGTILGNPALSQQRQIALALLDDFLNKKRPASDVFDAKKMGQYLATVDLWGAWHALTWNNWRWYYNPHLAKFEPIQSDVAVTPAKHNWLMTPPSHDFVLSKAMLNDPIIRSHYDVAKQTLIERINQNLIPELQAYEQTLLNKLHGDSPLLAPFDLTVMKTQVMCWQSDYQGAGCQNIGQFDASLHQHMQDYAGHANWDILARFNSRSGTGVLKLVNNDKEPLHLKSITGLNRYEDRSELEEVNADFPRVLNPGETLDINLPADIVAVDLRAALASKKIATFQFKKDIAPLHFIPRPQPLNASLMGQYPFIEVNEGHWFVKPGTWQINDFLVTPDNTELVLPAGAHLEFATKAGLMVFGHLTVKGTADNPASLTKQVSSRKWSGLSVFSNEYSPKSVVRHLNISYSSNPKLGLWQPRGATYFVKTPVLLEDIHISENQSEDGLNIINGDIEINRMLITNALSDAFDCDFCVGTVNDSEFRSIGFRSGGDGIDVSGSKLTLNNVSFNGVRDKAISGGERSHLIVNTARFNNVNFGLVAKDDTKITATNITAENVKHHALMSYSKKPIFGGAILDVSQFDCLDTQCENKITVETGSVLTINGTAIDSQDLDVKGLYRTIMKSDKPR